MIFSSTTQRAIRNKGMAAVYGLAAEFDCEPGDVLDLLVTTAFTETSIPVSPPLAPASHAPAADTLPSALAAPDLQRSVVATRKDARSEGSVTTDGEPGVLPSPLSVDPIAPPARKKRGLQNEVLRVHNEHRDWPASVIAGHIGTGREYVCATAKRLGIVLPSQREYDAAQAAKTADALRVAIQPEMPPAGITEPAMEAKPPTLAQRIRDHLSEHPDATLREVTDALGAKMQAVGWAAQKAGITLRKRNAQERSEASARGAQGRAKPSEPVTPPIEAPQPPEAAPEPRKAVVYRHSSPPGRFYLREPDGAMRFVHQSLQPCPTGPGPLMTSDRRWAWFDNAQRFKGAAAKWPEIATMRREAPQS